MKISKGKYISTFCDLCGRDLGISEKGWYRLDFTPLDKYGMSGSNMYSPIQLGSLEICVECADRLKEISLSTYIEVAENIRKMLVRFE